MKLHILLLFFCMKATASVNAQYVSISKNGMTLETFFAEVKKQTGYNCLYNNQMTKDVGRIDVSVNKLPLPQALNEVFRSLPLSFVIDGKTIILTQKKIPAPAAISVAIVMEVTGLVKDAASNSPLQLVTVQVKGRQQGTVTDENGRFRLQDVQPGAILVFSRVGYERLEMKADLEKSMTVALQPVPSGLNEVVVVGYGTQKKTDLTGAVTNVGEKVLQSRPVANLQDALQGRAPGVQVRQTGGDLNGRFAISIRGTGSVTGSNDPLIIVDDVPLYSGGLSTINPKDIVAIDILKDASATAIYGSRAANGVLIVTTRRGKPGKTQFTFSTDVNIEEIVRRYEVLSSEQQRLLFLQAFKNSNRNTAAFENPDDPVWKINTDWQKLGTRTAFRQNYNLSINGGSENNRFAISAGYLGREGVIRNSDLKSYFFRGNNDLTIKDRLKLSANLSGTHQQEHVVNNDSFHGGAYRGLISSHRYLLPYDEAGNLTAISTTADPYFGENSNPLIDLLMPVNERNTTRLMGNIKASLKLAQHLTLTGNIGADVVYSDTYGFLPYYKIGIFTRAIGSVTEATRRDVNWVSDLTLQYENLFGKHKLTALGGVSAQQFNTRSATVTGTGTVDNSLNQLSNQTNFTGDGGNVSAGLASSFIRVNYGFDNRYLLTATVRRDGSSKFSTEKQYGVFPSVSAAWRLTGEKFLQQSSVINELKLRSSYGVTGNQNIGDFAFITRAGAAPYVFGNSVVVGNAPQNIGNSLLQWESAKQFDAGFDLVLLNGRLALTADYYNKRSEDLLIRLPIPFTAGVPENPTVNLGAVKNTGVEIDLHGGILQRRFRWDADINVSFNRNRALDIGTNSIGDPLRIPGDNIALANEPANMTLAGREIGSFYMLQFMGLWQPGEEAEAAKWSGAVPGDPRYADLNNNGILDDGDKSFVGIPQPKVSGGFNNAFSYGSFSLSVFMNFAVGNKLYNSIRNLNARSVPFNQQLAEVAGFWTPEHTDTDIPKPSQGGNTTYLATRVSTRFLENADFLRLKNVSLSYELPAATIKRLGVTAARVTLSGTNLATITNYTGLDPEASSVANLLTGGIDHTPYPLTRQYTLSAQITF